MLWPLGSLELAWRLMRANRLKKKDPQDNLQVLRRWWTIEELLRSFPKLLALRDCAEKHQSLIGLTLRPHNEPPRRSGVSHRQKKGPQLPLRAWYFGGR